MAEVVALRDYKEGLAPILVLGAGSWGTALAMLFAKNGIQTFLWAHRADHVEQMRGQRSNEAYLPGIDFPPLLEPVSDLEAAVACCRDILLVVPSHVFRQSCELLKPCLREGHRICWATKGLELGTGKLLHEIVQEVLVANIPTAVISGPTFALEVAQGLPTAVTVASHFPNYSAELAQCMHNAHFRVYTSQDVVGVELGGAMKNVLAIAAGISDGLGFGANSRSALITRGLAEMMRLGMALGGQMKTFMGLTGIGDLVLTCTDDKSRNRRLGLALGQGYSADQAMAEIRQVVEGVQAAQVVWDLACRQSIDMPITEQVYRVLHEGVAPRQAVESLFNRELRAEDY